MDDFDSFAAEAADIFGMTENEAADLLAELEDAGFDVEQDSLHDEFWSDMALEVQDEVQDFDDVELPDDDSSEPDDDRYDGEDYDYADDVDVEYELDESWPDDEWLDADVEYEVTGDYKED